MEWNKQIRSLFPCPITVQRLIVQGWKLHFFSIVYVVRKLLDSLCYPQSAASPLGSWYLLQLLPFPAQRKKKEITVFKVKPIETA